MKAWIPNILTAANLFCGMLALMFVAQDAPWAATTAVAVALMMDFLDGFVARLLKVSSPVGKELDSLADCVTFGAVPGMIMARMIAESLGQPFPAAVLAPDGFPWYLTGFLIAVFSALRLAKFNLDERQSDAFYGVPTPANTMLIVSLWMVVETLPGSRMAELLSLSWVLVGISLLASGLLVADVRLLSLKFKNLRWGGNMYRFLLLGGSVILLAVYRFAGVPFIFILYLFLSVLDTFRLRRKVG
ncbi:MAG: CDP-diacylglycerol O-phosphatidyltransferase [Bacteroidetes bacterium]|nr:MAG: CDP-diacylglycerol O-phosphatidyltransferase [Bacteroidota bacterium]